MEDSEETETVETHEHDIPTSHDDSELRNLVQELIHKVQALEEVVGHIVAKGEPDSTPVRKPWTHWGTR